MIAAIPVVQTVGEKVESVVAAIAVAHVRAVPEEMTAAYQVLRVKEVLVKFEVVALTKAYEATVVEVKAPVAVTADPEVEIEVAVVP